MKKKAFDDLLRGELNHERLQKEGIPCEYNDVDEATMRAHCEELMRRTHQGAKNDRIDNKVRWELMPLDLLNEVAKVYTAGAEKYGENTWQNLENGYERYKAACIRHIISYEAGEQADPETGLHPLSHAAWNMIAMLYFALRKEEK